MNIELEILNQVAVIIKKARTETVRCAEDFMPVNLTLDYISEDIADNAEGNIVGFKRNDFLRACGFTSW